MAAGQGDVQKLEEWIRKGLRVDLRNPMGESALMMAAMTGQLSSLNFLLDHKANPNAVNLAKMSTLMIAASYGRAEICEALLRAGAGPTIENCEPAYKYLHIVKMIKDWPNVV